MPINQQHARARVGAARGDRVGGYGRSYAPPRQRRPERVFVRERAGAARDPIFRRSNRPKKEFNSQRMSDLPASPTPVRGCADPSFT